MIESDGRQVERYLVEQRGSVIHIEPDRSQRVRWIGGRRRGSGPAGTSLHARVAAWRPRRASVVLAID